MTSRGLQAPPYIYTAYTDWPDFQLWFQYQNWFHIQFLLGFNFGHKAASNASLISLKMPAVSNKSHAYYWPSITFGFTGDTRKTTFGQFRALYWSRGYKLNVEGK